MPGELLVTVISLPPRPDASTLPDAELVAAVQQGEQEAFAVLYERHYDSVLGACARRLANRHDAEEVTQAAFVRALERIDQCRQDRRFGAWVQTIAFRLGADLGRSRARSTPAADPLPAAVTALAPVAAAQPSAAEQPEEAALAGERRRHLAAALAVLPARQLAVLRARDVDGHGPMEIARSLGVTVGTVDSVLLRARRRVASTYQTLAAEQGVTTAGTAAMSTAVSAATAGRRPLFGALRRLGDGLAVRVGDVTSRFLGAGDAALGGTSLREMAAAATVAVALAAPGAGAPAPAPPVPAVPPAVVEVELPPVPDGPDVPPAALPPVTIPAPPPTPAPPSTPATPAPPAPPSTPAPPEPPVVLPVVPGPPSVVDPVTDAVTEAGGEVLADALGELGGLGATLQRPGG